MNEIETMLVRTHHKTTSSTLNWNDRLREARHHPVIRLKYSTSQCLFIAIGCGARVARSGMH